MSLHHYEGPNGIASYLASLYSTEVGLLCIRIALLLLLALIFWQCGPRIRALLLPEDAKPEEPPLNG